MIGPELRLARLHHLHLQLLGLLPPALVPKRLWRITKATLQHLPFRAASDGFVLSPPDFDSQNILVDDQGNVTGIIDWDLVQTLPSCVG